MNALEAMNQCAKIPSWLEADERERLFELAQEVRPIGTIVEVGCLYGGSTALLGLGAPSAELTIFDDFSWSPLAEMRACRETLFDNLWKAGIYNDIDLTEGDSRQTTQGWNKPIDLLWIDGGHSFDFIFSDLSALGPHAKVIACHDYDNPSWQSVRQAVEKFIGLHPEWRVDNLTRTLVTLRRKA